MERDELLLHLGGRVGHMEADALLQALGGLVKLLRLAVDPSSEAPAAWTISTLRAGSVDVGMRPRTDAAVNSKSIVTAGIERLAEDVGIPSGWNDAMIRQLLEIATVTTLGGVDTAELAWDAGRQRVRLDREVLVNAQESLSERRTSIGSVRGRLDRYFHRGRRREVGLVDEATGDAVIIDFDELQQGRISGALEMPVLAWGELRRNDRGQKIRLLLEDFEVLEETNLARPVDQIVGVLGDDWTAGQSSVDYVREQRA